MKSEEIETQTGEISAVRLKKIEGERLTGSPGSLPPRILKPNPVSFLHRKMSCSWKSGTVKSTSCHKHLCTSTVGLVGSLFLMPSDISFNTLRYTISQPQCEHNEYTCCSETIRYVCLCQHVNTVIICVQSFVTVVAHCTKTVKKKTSHQKIKRIYFGPRV